LSNAKSDFLKKSREDTKAGRVPAVLQDKVRILFYRNRNRDRDRDRNAVSLREQKKMD